MRHPKWVTLALCHLTCLSPGWHPQLPLLKQERRPALALSPCIQAGTTYYPGYEISPVPCVGNPQGWTSVVFPELLCGFLRLPACLPYCPCLSKTLFLEVPIFYIIHVTSHIHPWHPEINMKRMLSSLPSMPFHCMLLTYTSTDRSHGLRMLPYHSLGVLPLSFVLHPL